MTCITVKRFIQTDTGIRRGWLSWPRGLCKVRPNKCAWREGVIQRWYRRLVYALTIWNGDCRKLSYMQAAR